MANLTNLQDRLHCLGKYGFGNGYAVPEQIRYCDTICPVRDQCWAKHRERVEDEDGQMAEKFHRLVYGLAREHLWSLERARKYATDYLMNFGTPDPYTRLMLQNYDAGMDRRKQDDPGVENMVVRRRSTDVGVE